MYFVFLCFCKNEINITNKNNNNNFTYFNFEIVSHFLIMASFAATTLKLMKIL